MLPCMAAKIRSFSSIFWSSAQNGGLADARACARNLPITGGFAVSELPYSAALSKRCGRLWIVPHSIKLMSHWRIRICYAWLSRGPRCHENSRLHRDWRADRPARVGCRKPVSAWQVVVVSRRCCVCPGISLDLAGPNEAVRHQYSQ